MISEEKYLPIGTVVLLKGAEKRVMIIGFSAIELKESDETKVWDYSGCLYPEGFLNSEQICLFDHSQIVRIDHIGLIDDEEKKFKTELNKLKEKNM